MPIYDISLPITTSLVTWPDDPPITLHRTLDMTRGDVATVTQLHAAVHVDAPAHFVAGGAGVDTLPLDVLIGPALVVDTPDVDALTADVFASLPIPGGTERLLLHTRNSERMTDDPTTFDEAFVAITPDGARWLVEHGVRLIGIDYLSIAPFAAPIPTH